MRLVRKIFDFPRFFFATKLAILGVLHSQKIKARVRHAKIV